MSKVQISPLTFWPKINRGPPRVKVNIYVKYNHCMSNGRGVIVQKSLFHRWTDRQTYMQTAMVKPVYLHNFVGGGIQTYFQCGEIVEKWPPRSQNFMGGSHFFTTCGSKFNVKIWTVSAFHVDKWPGESLLTLKNDPGVIFQRGHYLMLHRHTVVAITCSFYQIEVTLEFTGFCVVNHKISLCLSKQLCISVWFWDQFPELVEFWESRNMQIRSLYPDQGLLEAYNHMLWQVRVWPTGRRCLYRTKVNEFANRRYCHLKVRVWPTGRRCLYRTKVNEFANRRYCHLKSSWGCRTSKYA